jgi:hypothetical protein
MERIPARAASNAPNANKATTTITPIPMLISVEIIMPIENEVTVTFTERVTAIFIFFWLQ